MRGDKRGNRFTDQDRADAERIETLLQEARDEQGHLSTENRKLKAMLANREDQLRRVSEELRRCQRALDGFYRAGQAKDDQTFATVHDFNLETDFNAVIRGGYLSDGSE